SARIDSIAFGYGKVWVLSSATATLYAIDPRSHPTVVTPLHIGPGRATRPEIMSPSSTDIWIRVTGDKGARYSIDPHRLRREYSESDGPPWWEEYEGQLDALWWYDQPYGYVSRQEGSNGKIKAIRVTRTRAKNGGPCLTSMAEAAGSMWVTVAPDCKR